MFYRYLHIINYLIQDDVTARLLALSLSGQRAQYVYSIVKLKLKKIKSTV